jgi:hypothetical protein
LARHVAVKRRPEAVAVRCIGRHLRVDQHNPSSTSRKTEPMFGPDPLGQPASGMAGLIDSQYQNRSARLVTASVREEPSAG